MNYCLLVRRNYGIHDKFVRSVLKYDEVHEKIHYVMNNGKVYDKMITVPIFILFEKFPLRFTINNTLI